MAHKRIRYFFQSVGDVLFYMKWVGLAVESYLRACILNILKKYWRINNFNPRQYGDKSKRVLADGYRDYRID